MNRNESMVLAYLHAHGHTNIVYEPDGKHPPDFLVDDRIAVEVRRLNQHERTAGIPRGLESTAIPLSALVRKVLRAVPQPTDGHNWFVSYSFRRPLPPWRAIERALAAHLTSLSENGMRNIDFDERRHVIRGVRIRLYRGKFDPPGVYLLGGWGDNDSGGFVIAEMARNLRICIEEKSRKVARVRERYPVWWLALVDYIGLARVSPDEGQQLRALVPIEPPWERIMLIAPDDATKGLTL